MGAVSHYRVTDFADIARKANAGGRFTWRHVDPRGLLMHGAKDRVMRDIERAVTDGFLAVSTGPRGGLGWVVTPAGQKEAEAQDKAFARRMARLDRSHRTVAPVEVFRQHGLLPGE